MHGRQVTYIQERVFQISAEEKKGHQDDVKALKPIY